MKSPVVIMILKKVLSVCLFHLFSTSDYVVQALKLKELIVPRHANLGSSAILVCKFDLGDASLYSVKWYKDEFEFFRFMPDNKPETQVFPVNGISLDESQSGMNSVTLTGLSYNSTGSYRCEVSREAPSFETVFANGFMTVLAYPASGPVIHGVQTTYHEGDYVFVNCTASPSNPPPEVDWYINGLKADPWLIDKSQISSVDGKFTKSVELRFVAEKQYFQGSDSTLELRCRSTVGDLQPWESTVTLHLSTPLNNQKLAQERYRNQGISRQSLPSKVLLAMYISYLLLT